MAPVHSKKPKAVLATGEAGNGPAVDAAASSMSVRGQSYLLWGMWWCACIPGLAAQARYWWVTARNPAFAVIYLVLLWLLIRNFKSKTTAIRVRAWMGRALMLSSCVFLGLGYLLGEPHLVQVGFSCGIVTLFLWHAPKFSTRRACLVGMYTLLLATPVSLIRAVGAWAESQLTRVVAAWLDFQNVSYFLNDQKFQTEAGVYPVSLTLLHGGSLMIVLTIVGGVLVWRRRSLFLFLVQLIASPVFCVAFSALILGGLILLRIDVQYLGWNLIWPGVLSLAMIFFHAFVLSVFEPIPPPGNQDLPPLSVEAFNRVVRWPLAHHLTRAQIEMNYKPVIPKSKKRATSEPVALRFWMVFVVPCFMLASLASLVWIQRLLMPESSLELTPEQLSIAPQSATVDLSKQGFESTQWKRVDRTVQDPLGEFSSQWISEDLISKRTLILDYPIRSYIPISEALKQKGWQVLEEAVELTTTGGVPFSEMLVAAPDDGSASLLFFSKLSTEDKNEVGFAAGMRQKIQKGALGLVWGDSSQSAVELTAQLHMLYQTDVGLIDLVRDEERSRFADSLDLMNQQWSKMGRTGPPQ